MPSFGTMEAICATNCPLELETGLAVFGEPMLPFILAARAQGELAHGSAKGRTFFAEGLCSSYKAFHHTRDNRGDARDMDDDGIEKVGRAKRVKYDNVLVPVSWYEEQIEPLIPTKCSARGCGSDGPCIHRKNRCFSNDDAWACLRISGVFKRACRARTTTGVFRRHIGRRPRLFGRLY